MKVFEALKDATVKLAKTLKEQKAAQKEAEELLMNALSITRARLYMNFHDEIPPAELKKFKSNLARRLKGTPLQYILGSAFFYNREFLVNEGVLIPRPDTEALIEAVKKYCPKDLKEAAECGCGTGILALTLLKELPQIEKFTCFDINKKAIANTKSNARLQGLKDRVAIGGYDFFSYHKKSAKKYSLVISNPPYVKTSDLEKLQKEVQKEPRSALDGGKDGLDFYRAFYSTAPGFMAKNGILALEIGDKQEKAVRKIFAKGWKYLETFKDFREKPRAVAFRRIA
jgi:release factor glutamine methyltransferase